MSMTLVTPSLRSLRLASPDHPRFVGLALLRSLLTHEDVASQPNRSDAVLDLIALLLRDAPAKQVVKAFCRVRQQCGDVCYLAIFRLRRWLEQQMVVKTTDGPWLSLDLSFKDFRRIEQHFRRHAWESGQDEASSWNTEVIDFAWNCTEVPGKAVEETAAI